jgi:hypothetical protein
MKKRFITFALMALMSVPVYAVNLHQNNKELTIYQKNTNQVISSRERRSSRRDNRIEKRNERKNARNLRQNRREQNPTFLSNIPAQFREFISGILGN